MLQTDLGDLFFRRSLGKLDSVHVVGGAGVRGTEDVDAKLPQRVILKDNLRAQD